VSSLENLDHSSVFSNSWCSFLPASICWLRSVFLLCPLALVLRVQTGAAKFLRAPLPASALDLVTVPASPHTQRDPEHSLGRVRLSMEEEWSPKTHRTLCVLRVETGAAKCLRAPLPASALDLATVPASQHTQRGPEHSLGRVRLGLERASGFQKTTSRYVCSL
jgi:hypothetical protein